MRRVEDSRGDAIADPSVASENPLVTNLDVCDAEAGAKRRFVRREGGGGGAEQREEKRGEGANEGLRSVAPRRA